MATNKTLTVDTGVVEYDVNGVAKVRFNPSDANFVDRFHKTLQELDRRQDAMEAEVDGAGDDPSKMLELLSARDAEMRGRIDSLLGEGVADAVFPGINCYALADGLPAWMNLMIAIADEISDGIDAQRELTDPRVRAISDKSDALLAKYRAATAKRKA